MLKKFFLSLLLVCSLINNCFAEVIILQQTTVETGRTAVQPAASGGIKAGGQHFKLDLSARITKIAISLQWQGSQPTENFLIKIFASDVNRHPTGTALGTSATVAGSAIGSTLAWYDFTFSTSVTVDANPEYIIQFQEENGNTTAVGEIAWGCSDTSVYADGFYIRLTGSTWADNTSWDGGFKIYGEVITRGQAIFIQ